MYRSRRSSSAGREERAVDSQTHPIEQRPDPIAPRAAREGAAVRPLAQVSDCLSRLAGLYLAVSPWVVGFHTTASALAAKS
jgi:hypothetical protein